MDTSSRAIVVLCCASLLAPSLARPSDTRHELLRLETEVDIVGDVHGTNPLPRKALHDTIWIADWTFDAAGGGCDDTGWTRIDNRILNDGTLYWEITADFDGTGAIEGQAAGLGYNEDICCVAPNGYDNDWYQAIRIQYRGTANLSFDYLVDSETNRDLLRIESDSACASFARVDYDAAPHKTAVIFRSAEFSASGLDLDGSVVNHPLADYGPGTHCAYISFLSNSSYSPCDGFHATTIGEGVVIDNVSITDADGTRLEDFEDGTLDIGTFENMHDIEPFGQWARLFKYITDNDFCAINRTCAWLGTDDTTPTLANDPSMAFGPGSYVVRNWLDDAIVSPWVSLASAPSGTGTVFEYRIFPGNLYAQSRIVHNWSVRGRKVVDGVLCISDWERTSHWNSLNQFHWVSARENMSAYFDAESSNIQIRFRTSDWQWLMGASPPSPFIPGPGPFVDRTRIGRIVLSGPMIQDFSFSQAQDAFATEILPTGPGTGEHFQPTTDRFGSCAFSSATDLVIYTSPNLIIGDSIFAHVWDAREAGGVTSIDWYGAIVQGPHTGKAPAPWTVGSDGFFVVPADSVRYLRDRYFVDLDDTYFRGGDKLLYFWLAADALGGVTSMPTGLSAAPASIAEAETETGGLLEVSFLPTIEWDPVYLARIAADAHGDLDPTAIEISNSSQRNCILYVQQVNLRRRSGGVNRTSFMYTLDRLGYREAYDVYDHTGCCRNNHLGGRATIEQAEGYNLIVYDSGNTYSSMPDGSDLETEKVDQATWFRDWLAQMSTSEAGFAALWVISSNALEEKPTAALYNTDMGVLLSTPDQGLSLNPDVQGVASFTFDRGNEQATVDFSSDFYSLNGGCPSVRNYDGLAASNGTAVATHQYRSPATAALGDAAIVMNRNDPGNWNTIFQSHPWFDIRDPAGTPATPAPELVLLDQILDAALPTPCQQEPNPVDVREDGELETPPIMTALHQNVPNPFNPTTTIRFNLALDDHVSLQIYDVAGRLVRTLLDQEMLRGWNHRVVWDGLDEEGTSVSSGIYFCRLKTSGVSQSRKMLMMR